jgi:hypothetical protein
MSRVGFEPTIPVFERAKTVHSLASAATVIGTNSNYNFNNAIPRLILYNQLLTFRISELCILLLNNFSIIFHTISNENGKWKSL